MEDDDRMDDVLLTKLNELFQLMSQKDPKTAENIKKAITSYKDNLSMDNDLLKRLTVPTFITK
jgi:hypothetical protein